MLTDDELAAVERLVDAYDSDSRYVLGDADAATLRALVDRARNGGSTPQFAVIVDPDVPPGEVHFKHPDGRVDKLVNAASPSRQP